MEQEALVIGPLGAYVERDRLTKSGQHVSTWPCARNAAQIPSASRAQLPYHHRPAA
jgi:hypothetical protein